MLSTGSPFNLRLGPLARPFRALRLSFPPVNFITVHYTYFIATCLISAVIFWASSTPAKSVSFTDSLFLCISAMSLAGLNTVNLSELNTWQQCMLFFLIMLGSAIFVSAFTVHVRKRAFETKFDSITTEQRKQKLSRNRSASSRRFSLPNALSRRSRASEHDELEMKGVGEDDLANTGKKNAPERGRSIGTIYATSSACNSVSALDELDDNVQSPQDRITFSLDTRFTSPGRDGPHRRRGSMIFSAYGVGARPTVGLYPTTSHSHASSMLGLEDGGRPPTATDLTSSYFPSSGFVTRNSQFYGLSAADREKLGGVEYKAICFLSWMVPLYYILFQLLGSLGLAAYVAINRPDTARANGLNPWWVGAFNGVSAFNNSGMSLLDANMTAFQTSYYMLLTMGVLILAGNTCYPIFLRLGIWTMLKLMPNSESWEERRSTLRFLLDHPRRCYTNLFQSEHTWWLAFAVFVLNGVDWAAFEILNLGNEKLNSTLPTHIRVIDGLFQAFAVRSGGFYVVAIPTVRISLQVLYVIMMYISVYPVVITMRNSNVYEERTLGIYADDQGRPEQDPANGTNQQGGFWQKAAGLKRRLASAPNLQEGTAGYFVRQQLRAQLSHDLWWIVLAVFLIMIIEGGKFETDPATFSVFNVMFEIVSAYGTVGISVGVPDDAYSFCGAWHKLSKLVLCAVMIRGRHRGLPVALDKAVLLPHERQDGAEEEDAMIRISRAASRTQEQECSV